MAADEDEDEGSTVPMGVYEMTYVGSTAVEGVEGVPVVTEALSLLNEQRQAIEKKDKKKGSVTEVHALHECSYAYSSDVQATVFNGLVTDVPIILILSPEGMRVLHAHSLETIHRVIIRYNF